LPAPESVLAKLRACSVGPVGRGYGQNGVQPSAKSAA
jgi:hypothetical protein